MKVEILFEDNHLLVVNKPVNMPVQEDESEDPDLLSYLKQYIKEKYNKPGNVFLGLVHRLDRPAGGVMVYARTSKAASRLSEQLRKGEFHKSYLAVVNHKPPEHSGSMRHFLIKNRKTNIVSATSVKKDGGKEALLDYKVLGNSQGLSLVRIKLHTGRSHQIRVQMATSGCPLWGDQKYGKDSAKVGQQLALWAVKLVFRHPVRDERMEFICLPPKKFPWNAFPPVKP